MSKIFVTSNDLKNFNKIFRKNVIYDTVKNNKKTGFHPLSKKRNFGKTKRWVNLTLPSLFKVNAYLIISGDEFHMCASSDLKFLCPNLIISEMNIKIVFSVS